MEEYRVLTFRDFNDLERFLSTRRVRESEPTLHFEENHGLPVFLYSGKVEDVELEQHRVLTFRQIHEFAAFLQRQPVINCSFQSDAEKFNHVPSAWILSTLLGSSKLKSFTADYSKSFGNMESCKLLGELLQTSMTLETLSLNGVAMSGDGLEYIVRGLLDNSKSVLRRLEVGSLKNLNAKGVQLVTELFSREIRGNTGLVKLGLRHAQFSCEEWKQVFASLRMNEHVEGLDLSGGAGLDQAFECLMELIQANCTIKQIQLDSTSLEVDGRSSQVNAVLARNKRLSAYLEILKGSTEFVPPSSGRVFICGYPGAGKTTLKRSMVRGQISKWIRKAMGPLKEKYWHDNQSNTRTQGIEVQVLHTSGDKHITLWDMAGEDEYHTLHSCHYLFPDINQSCIFLFVYRPYDDDGAKRLPDPKAASERLKMELLHWLNFINSNSRKTGWVLPKTSVVLTHLDKVLDDKWFRSAERYVAWANDAIGGLREAFRGRVEVHDNVHAVDGHQAQNVVDHVISCFDHLFRDLPKVPAACEKMNLVLSQRAVQHPSEPIIMPERFFDLCSNSVTELQVLFRSAQTTDENNRHQNQWAVLSYLHDAGSIINVEESKCVVVDPVWLGRVFLGELFKPGAFPPTEKGIVPDHILENYLAEFISIRRYRGFDVQHLIKLMEELELCYESTSGKATPKYYFIPRALHDPSAQTRVGRRELRWTLQQTNSLPNHRGFRLQIAGQSQNFLSAGVFQRYQFLTRVRIVCDVEQNLVRVKHDGMEMLVETSGEGGDYVDILIRSYGSGTGGMQKLYTDVLQEFRSICESRRDCAGVTLQEAILRPACVENPTLCIYRKNQAVLRESLKDDLMKKLLNSSEEQEIRVQGANANDIPDDFFEERNHYHPFPAVPDANLLEEWVKATDMLTMEDIKEAISKYRQSVSESVSQQINAICQAGDELLGNTTISGAASSPTITEVKSQNGVSPRQVNAVPTEWQAPISYMDGMERRMRDDLKEKFRRLEDKIQIVGDSIMDELKENKQLLRQLLQKSMEDVQELHRNRQGVLIDKLDQVLCATEAVQSMPKIPYFTDTGVGLPQRIVSFIQFGAPLKLHFMCEEPSKVHYIEEQKGLPIINLSEK